MRGAGAQIVEEVTQQFDTGLAALVQSGALRIAHTGCNRRKPENGNDGLSHHAAAPGAGAVLRGSVELRRSCVERRRPPLRRRRPPRIQLLGSQLDDPGEFDKHQLFEHAGRDFAVQRPRQIGELRPTVGARQIRLLGELPDQVLRERQRRCLEAPLECLRPFFGDQRVRVVPFGQEQKPDLLAVTPSFGNRLLQRAPSRCPAGAVAVEREYHLTHEVKEALEVLGRGGGSQGRHRIGQPGLVQAHGIHVPLDHEHALQLRTGAPRLVQSVELAPLVEEHRLRRVQVLRLTLIDDPAAEGDDPASDVPDRKHQSIAEAVVVAIRVARRSAVALDDQAELGERFAIRLVAPEAPQHLIPGVGSKPDAEFLHRGGVQPAFQNVGFRPLVAAQDLCVELRDTAHELVQRLIRPARSRGGAIASLMGDIEVEARRELLDRLGEGDTVIFHQEAQRRPVRSAAEAVIELLHRAHPEGGRLLVVERTACSELATRFFQLHASADELHDVRAGDQLVDERLRNEPHQRLRIRTVTNTATSSATKPVASTTRVRLRRNILSCVCTMWQRFRSIATTPACASPAAQS